MQTTTKEQKAAQFGASVQIHKFVFDEKKNPNQTGGTNGANGSASTPATSIAQPTYKCQYYWCSNPSARVGTTFPSSIPFPSVPIVQWGEPAQYHTLSPHAMNNVGDRVLIVQIIEISAKGSNRGAGGTPNGSPDSDAHSLERGTPTTPTPLQCTRQDTNTSLGGFVFGDRQTSSATIGSGGGVRGSPSRLRRRVSGQPSSQIQEKLIAHGTIDLGMFAHKPAKDYAVRLEKNFVSVGKLLLNLCVAPLDSPLFEGKTQVDRKLMLCIERLTVTSHSAANMVPSAEYTVKVKFSPEISKRTPTAAATQSGDNVRWNYEVKMEPTRKLKLSLFQGRTLESSVTVDAGRIQGSLTGGTGKREFSIPMKVQSTGCEAALLLSSFYVDSGSLNEDENNSMSAVDLEGRSGITAFGKEVRPGRSPGASFARVPSLQRRGSQQPAPVPKDQNGSLINFGEKSDDPTALTILQPPPQSQVIGNPPSSQPTSSGPGGLGSAHGSAHGGFGEGASFRRGTAPPEPHGAGPLLSLSSGPPQPNQPGNSPQQQTTLLQPTPTRAQPVSQQTVQGLAPSTSQQSQAPQPSSNQANNGSQHPYEQIPIVNSMSSLFAGSSMAGSPIAPGHQRATLPGPHQTSSSQQQQSAQPQSFIHPTSFHGRLEQEGSNAAPGPRATKGGNTTSDRQPPPTPQNPPPTASSAAEPPISQQQGPTKVLTIQGFAAENDVHELALRAENPHLDHFGSEDPLPPNTRMTLPPQSRNTPPPAGPLVVSGSSNRADVQRLAENLEYARTTIHVQQDEITMLKQQLATLTQVVQLSLMNSTVTSTRGGSAPSVASMQSLGMYAGNPQPDQYGNYPPGSGSRQHQHQQHHHHHQPSHYESESRDGSLQQPQQQDGGGYGEHQHHQQQHQHYHQDPSNPPVTNARGIGFTTQNGEPVPHLGGGQQQVNHANKGIASSDGGSRQGSPSRPPPQRTETFSRRANSPGGKKRPPQQNGHQDQQQYRQQPQQPRQQPGNSSGLMTTPRAGAPGPMPVADGNHPQGHQPSNDGGQQQPHHPGFQRGGGGIAGHAHVPPIGMMDIVQVESHETFQSEASSGRQGTNNNGGRQS